MLTLKIVLSGEDAFEKDLSKSPTLGRGKQGSKMDMMMMMMSDLYFMVHWLFLYIIDIDLNYCIHLEMAPAWGIRACPGTCSDILQTFYH